MTKGIEVQRFSVTSSKAFHKVVAAFEAAVGHPEMNAFRNSVAAAGSFAEVETIVGGATGPSGLMEFTRMDLGAVLRKRNGASAPQSIRFILNSAKLLHIAERYGPLKRARRPISSFSKRTHHSTFTTRKRFGPFGRKVRRFAMAHSPRGGNNAMRHRVYPMNLPTDLRNTGNPLFPISGRSVFNGFHKWP